jgi:hypothetical protein
LQGLEFVIAFLASFYRGNVVLYSKENNAERLHRRVPQIAATGIITSS